MTSATFQSIYEAHAPDVRRLALCITRSPDAAAEITSETFLRAWTGRLSIRTETAKAYLLAIARNLAIDHLRRPAQLVPIEDHHAVALSAGTASIELQQAFEAISHLPGAYRDALLLAVVEGLSYEETARVLGVSLACAKVRVHRARLMLVESISKKEIP
ncbi:MAG TPA: RNA polymerase sigma factor [Bryobacteraceae bacterium]|nr:RNA polymerase sigma factor [Bryobacteraceae bacterium]HPT25242.1 RNA polymerase sigma factor [Bryobacteraceae bacterium]